VEHTEDAIVRRRQWIRIDQLPVNRYLDGIALQRQPTMIPLSGIQRQFGRTSVTIRLNRNLRRVGFTTLVATIRHTMQMNTIGIQQKCKTTYSGMNVYLVGNAKNS
jgi:hypothetical protein